MPLPALTRADLSVALKDVGVQPGDGLLVHSAMQMLGQPEGGLLMVFDAISALIGTEGTLAVPTFSFTSDGEFDPQTTPSKGMGAFSEFVRQLPQAHRTTHPMQSLAVVGKHAADLAQRDTLAAFDAGGVFERTLELDFKLLLLGAEVQAASMVHYSEQRAGVPYRYWMEFTGRIKLNSDWQTKTYRMFVRDLELDPQLKLAPIQHALETKRLWKATKLNYGQVACCRLVDFVGTTDALLAADPWALVANRPEKAGWS